MKWFCCIAFCLFTYVVAQAQTNNLAYYLQHAITSSPLLKDINNQVRGAGVDSLRLRAGYRPQVGFNGSGVVAPVIHGFGYATAITNGQTLTGLVTATQALVSRNYLNSQLYSIQLSADSLRNSYKISEQDLKKNIIAQYITAYGSLEQYKFSKEVVELLRTEDDLLKKLTRSNVYRQSDYLTFLVTLKQQELQMAQSRLQYKTDFAMLNYLSGIADTSITDLDKPDIQKNIMKPDIRTSIFFQQYKLDSLRLVNNRRLVDFSYRPKGSFYVDGGYNTDFNPEYYRNFGTSAGFSLAFPIYDGGQRKMQYKKLALEEDSRKNYKAFFNSQYKQQVDQLNQQINQTESLLTDITEQMKYSETLIKVDAKLMQTGDLKIADLILAVNNYLTVKNLLTQTTVSRLQLINQLNYWNR